jgi:hypothetical protein
MRAARASEPGTPATAEPSRTPASAPHTLSLAGNRTVARALADAAASRALPIAGAAASRTLARCPGCGGRCAGACGAAKPAVDEELLDTGQRALRRAVLARRQSVSARS